MQEVFQTTALDATSWLVVLTLGLGKFLAVEAEKGRAAASASASAEHVNASLKRQQVDAPEGDAGVVRLLCRMGRDNAADYRIEQPMVCRRKPHDGLGRGTSRDIAHVDPREHRTLPSGTQTG
jgi:hypothetical protein